MRLIDADALMDTIRKHEYRLTTKQGSIDYGMFTSGIQQAVDEQPTINAVPVVRCKYCIRRYDTDECPMCFLIEGKYYEYTNENGFCDRGERKEGAE